jgi:hypothetical protein
MKGVIVGGPQDGREFDDKPWALDYKMSPHGPNFYIHGHLPFWWVAWPTETIDHMGRVVWKAGRITRVTPRKANPKRQTAWFRRLMRDPYFRFCYLTPNPVFHPDHDAALAKRIKRRHR